MTTKTSTWMTLYESPNMTIEERSDGILCVTTKALAREPLSRWLYAGWTAQEVSNGFSHLPDDLHYRIMSQIFG